MALNVYLALCYYKLDYYDVSLEVLQVYLTQFPDSATALNLRACNHYKLYNGKAAEAELRTLQDQATAAFQFARDIIHHNMVPHLFPLLVSPSAVQVVFRNGEAALQILPPLIDILPEARLNLVIYHLQKGQPSKAALCLLPLFFPSSYCRLPPSSVFCTGPAIVW